MGDRKRGHPDLGPPPRWLYCPRKGSPIVGGYIFYFGNFLIYYDFKNTDYTVCNILIPKAV